MSLRRAFYLFTYLAAFWAFVMLALFAELHASAVIIFLTFFFLGIFKERLGIRISSTFWLVLSLSVLFSALYGWFIIGERLYSVVYLFLYLEINKLWTGEKERDTLQVYGLTFFQVLAASVSTASVYFAPALAIYLFLILGALITFTIKRDAELALGGKLLPAGSSDSSREHARRRLEAVNDRAYLTPRFCRWLSGALSIVLLFGTALFFIIPRLQAQSFLSSYTPRSQNQMVSGFNDTVEFTGIGEIQTDPTIAMRVIPKRGFPMKDGFPTLDALRLRGTALDYYDGRRWSKGAVVIAGTFPAERRRGIAFKTFPAFINPKASFDMEIQLEPNRKGFLFGPDRTSVLGFEKDSVFVQIDPNSDSVQATIGNWINALKYTTQCSLPVDRWWELQTKKEENPSRQLMKEFQRLWGVTLEEEESSGLMPELREGYLQLPAVKDMDVVRKLADEWTGKLTSTHEIATTIESNLKQRFSYSLDVDFSRSSDHLTRFLTVEKAGHCEYFATAMVLMLRTRGIPARVVNGYATDEWVQSGGGYYIVRQEHAHSWVEAFFPNAGWITFDPTPYNGIGGNRIPMTVYRWMTRWLDMAKFFWYDHFIDYDVRDQGFMFRLLFRGMDLLNVKNALRVTGLQGLAPERFNERRTLLVVIIAVVAFIIGVLLVREIIRMRRARKRAAAGSAAEDHRPSIVIAEYLDLLGELEGLFVRPRAQTPLEYARTVATRHEALGDFLALTEVYYGARFNRDRWGEPEIGRVNALLRLVKEQRQHLAP